MGSTGSIGTQALEVIDGLDYRVLALAAGKNTARAEEQIRKYKPKYAAMADEAAAKELALKTADTDVKILSGSAGIKEISALSADIVLNAIVGVAGLIPTLTAIEAGSDIALANKEQLQWQFPVAPIGLFVCWPLFYNIGAWLAKSGLSDRLRLRVCLPLWALSAVLVLLAEEHSAAAYKMGLRPDTTVYTLLTWAVLWSLFSRLPEIPKPLQFIARHSFGLYLAHPLVLRLWNAWAVRQTPVIYLHLWQMFALALAGGRAIAVTLSYLPFGEYLGGAKRTKKILQRRA